MGYFLGAPLQKLVDMFNVLLWIGFVIQIVIDLFIIVYVVKKLCSKSIKTDTDSKKQIKGKKQTSPQVGITKKEYNKIVGDMNDFDNDIESLGKRIKNLEIKHNKLSKDVDELEHLIKVSLKETEAVTSSEKKIEDKKIKTKESKKKLDRNYINLTIRESRLVEVEAYEQTYYRTWLEDGKYYFEFVESERIQKVINNRFTIIEPFCDNSSDSNLPDESTQICVIQPGELNSEYNVIKKVIIKYL